MTTMHRRRHKAAQLKAQALGLMPDDAQLEATRRKARPGPTNVA